MKSPSRRFIVIALSVFLCGNGTTVYAQSNFFEGKNIRTIVGLAAGGGYDVYARMIARHMGKHIPGNPAISVEKWLASKQVVKFGGIASGTGSDDVPNILKATIGLPLQLVTGYKGTSEIRLAFNGGEVSGVSISWESAKSTWRKEVESGDMVIVLQGNTKSHPELTKIPISINFAKTDEAKKLMQIVLQAHGPTVRPFVLPPRTAKDRVQMLRKAFITR